MRRKLDKIKFLKIFNFKQGEKPHVCKFCQRPFSDKSNLIKHEVTHSVEKQFECAMCNKKYAHKRSLRDHLKTH